MNSSTEPVRFVRPTEKRRRIPVAAMMALSFGTLILLSIGGVLALTVGANIRNTLDLLGAQSTLLVDAMEDSLRAEMGQAENAVDGVSRLYAQGEFLIDDDDEMSAVLAGALSAARQATAMLICTPDLICRGVARDADGKFVPMELASRFETIVTQICDAITPRFEGVQYVLLHGDCHSGNILWNRDDPYFIDFDDMLYAPPVQDIWMLTGADDEYGKEQRRILLEAYEQIRIFDMSTMQLIEPLRALRMIHFSAWIARRWEDSAFKAAFPDFGTEHYWQEQIEALALQLEKVRYDTTDLYR